jgi:hypothetical protein
LVGKEEFRVSGEKEVIGFFSYAMSRRKKLAVEN